MNKQKGNEMKNLKKFIKMLTAVVMMMAMTVTTFAASITVENVLEGETYKAYKILEFTSDTTKTPAAYSYFLETSNTKTEGLKTILEGAGFTFTESADGSQYILNETEMTADAIVAALKTAGLTNENVLAYAEATAASDGEAVFTDLETGYWFVTSTLGSLCAIASYDDQELIVEKNTTVTDEKVVDENSANAQVGDVLNYTITLTDGKGTNLAATITDTLSKGLTYNADAKASINGGEATSITGVETQNDDGSTKVVYTFDAATMTALEDGQKIVVTYTATVNADASIDGTVSNTEYTEYSKQKTEGNTVDTELTDMTVNKTDGTNALKGAQFKLYRTDSAHSLNHVDVKLRQLTDDELTAAGVTKAANTVYYTVDPNGTNLIDMAQKNGDDYLYSSAVVYGLDKDSTYYLEETKAPEGYNLLKDEKEVSLGTTTSIDVVNQSGTVLPSTGGIGTTLFYVIGAALVLGSGILMVSKKRMGAD